MKNSKTKKILSILLAVIMVVGMIPAAVISASAACPIDGATGSGTESNPVIVDTFAELKAALEYSDELYIQVDTDIECTETLRSMGIKTLTLNGRLHGKRITIITVFPQIGNVFVLQGTGSIISEEICINASASTTLKGDVTYESTEGNAVFSNASDLRIEGGTFKGNTYGVGLYLNDLKATFAGGSFPGGISGFSGGTYELENGYMFQYKDGTISGVLQPGVSVDVVYVEQYDMGFATQIPEMPEGETITHLGDFIAGTDDANITFGFSANPLSAGLQKEGFSVVEEMKVFSYNNGLIKEQSSGASCSIALDVVDTYTVIETIMLKDSKGVICETLRHAFTVSTHPEGYVADSNCPIEGATGSGTELDPVIVDTYAELKAALEYSEKLYIQVDGYIECLETLEVAESEKILTVNGTLHCEDTVLSMSLKNNMTLQGNGKILSDGGACLLTAYRSDVKIKGNITFETNEKYVVDAPRYGNLTIDGGVFKSNSENGSSIKYNSQQDSYAAMSISLSGGSFPNGIYGRVDCTLATGCYYMYDGDIVSSNFTSNVPVDVINTGYILDFKTQTPTMPEGKTETHLGNFIVGSEEANITFGFTSNPLPEILSNSGFVVEEKMEIFSYNNGLIKEQSSGASYSIDPDVEDTYTVVETITFKDGDTVLEEIKHIFAVSIHPEGYVVDADCPVEGATGTGTESDPVIVDSFVELKSALEYSKKLYVQVDGYIECSKTLKPSAEKTLTVNGVLHSKDTSILEVWNNGFVLQGEGQIINERSSCIVNYSDNMIIQGDLEIHSDGIGYVTITSGLGCLTILGGTISNTSLPSLYINPKTSVVLGGGNFLNGISGATENVTSYGDLYVYEDGTISEELIEGEPVTIFKLLKFQAPTMPENTYIYDLGDGNIECNSGEIGFGFSTNDLPEASVKKGYSIVESQKVYSKKQDKFIFTNDNGSYYYLDTADQDKYTIYQTISVLDADGNTVKTVEYTYTANVGLFEVNLKVDNPHTGNNIVFGQEQTVRVKIASETWYLVNDDGTLTEKDFNDAYIEGKTYRYMVTLEATENFELTSNYTLYINGVAATKESGDTWYMDFVAQRMLLPIVNQDTFFMVAGDSIDVEVSAIGKDVKYYWREYGSESDLSLKGNGTNKVTIAATEDVEGTYEYLVSFTDAYGNVEYEVITVHVSKMGFKEIGPSPTAEELESGETDLGYRSEVCLYIESHELSQGFIDAGYTVKTTTSDYMDGKLVGSEERMKIAYDVTYPGAHKVVQKIEVFDADGNIFREYSHIYYVNITRLIFFASTAYEADLTDVTIDVYHKGNHVSRQNVGESNSMDLTVPVGEVTLAVSKLGYKTREYVIYPDAEGTYMYVQAELLRWGDANLDDVIDVLDYQQTINKGLSDNHKLDGSYEQSVMDWAEDGYIDVIDCFYSILCINGNALYSASLEYDEYYTIEGATLSIPVIADGFGLEYQWTAPEGAPQIVEGTENKDTVQIDVALNKGYLGNTYTYTCKVNDRFFNESILTVDVTVEELGNLYAVTYSSQYDELADQLPGKVYVKKGESITISDTVPEMDGYTFLYWRTGDLQRFSPGDTYKPYQNTVISPYMGKNYTITLHSGYEGELFGTHTGCYGHHYDLPDMDYMPEGYVFYGWTDVEGSTDVKYTKGATYEIKGDVDLYPVIAKASDVKLTIYANDGTDTVIYTQTLADEGASSFTIPEDLEMPTRDGYVCRYFYIDPNYVHGDYHEERLLYPGSEIIAGADGINLYVIWIPEYSVTYDSGTDDENVYVPYPETYGYGDYASVSTDKPYREGYNFLYWEDANGTKYYGNEIIIVESAIVLTAVWEKIDTENYEIWIAGQKVSKANPVVQCGTGTARVVEDEWGYCTIILDGVQITGTEGIRTEYNSIDIEVYGENTITVSGDDARGIIGSNGNISITGPGSLTINATGDGAQGIYGLHGVDYTNITVNATPETEDGVTYGITSSSDLWINNGAVLTVTGTCGFAIHGINADSTSRIYATGTRYGFYNISSFMGFGGRIVAKGGISAISTTNSYFESWHPSGMVTSYSTSIDGSNLAIWDGSEKFYDDYYSTSGVKYVEIHPVLCTDGHSPSTFEGLDTGCESDGLTDGEYCSACGYIITEREYVEATGHDYHTHNGKEPTCTEQGVDGTYTQCDKCGEYQGDVTFIDATGHSWGEWILIDGTDVWYDEYGYGEREYIRYCYNCDEYERIWYSYEDPNDTGSPNDWESGGAGPAKPY